MINYDALRQIPIDSVLRSYNVKILGSGPQLKSECPIPSHPKSERHNSFSFNTEKNKWVCHDQKCGGSKGGSVLDLVMLLDGCDLKAACQKLRETFLGNQNAGQQARRNDLRPRAAVPLDDTSSKTGNKPLTFRLKDVNPAHELIQSRGISIETCWKYGIGYFPGAGSMKGRIVFELRERGVLVGYAGRAICPETKPKWLLPKDFVKFCYGLEFCDPKRIMIVGESFWLPAFMHEKGWQACSVMGCELTERMEQELEPYKEIIVAMDGDEAGRAARERVVARLKERGHKVIRSSLVE